MPTVDYTKENLQGCQCPKCPVENRSDCAEKQLDNAEQELLVKELPLPGEVPEIYCAKGKTNCGDLNFSRECVCPTCPVWEKENLSSRYYCREGSAKENG